MLTRATVFDHVVADEERIATKFGHRRTALHKRIRLVLNRENPNPHCFHRLYFLGRLLEIILGRVCLRRQRM